MAPGSAPVVGSSQLSGGVPAENQLMTAASPPLPRSVVELLAAFHEAHGLDAAVWRRAADGWVADARAGVVAALTPPSNAVPVPPVGQYDIRVHVGGGGGQAHARFLAQAIAQALRHEEESRFFGREIGERYEEITLLYSISEILGSVISLKDAAGTILREVAATLAVQRAALWLHDPEGDRLDLVAAYGIPGPAGPILVSDEESITATAFRRRETVNLDPGEVAAAGLAAELPLPGSLLSVPVSYSPPDGESRTIGVINLLGRGPEHRFDSGNQKLMMAIASQIGAAVENSRLVEQSVRRERMEREMELAYDLQMKLLPSLEQFNGYAEVAARCVPAESVGGDFYHLFRLPGGRLGVMIGDVSSHGFASALIMALTMSAVAIHASEGDSPGEVLRRTHRTLIDELESTEMYLTLFYGVIDPGRGEIAYANAGHGHAFQIRAGGEQVRLDATNPPLGIIDLDEYGEESVPWDPEGDLLMLFTDGLSDALEMGEARGPRRVVEEVVAHRDLPVGEILDALYALAPEALEAVDDRTAVLVRF